MGQGDFSWAGMGSSPNQPRIADGVVGRAKGALGQANFSLPAVMPAIEWIRVTSRASSKVIFGMMPGIALAIKVFPQPGGPDKRILCAPAAAISKALLTWACPLMSAKIDRGVESANAR